MDSKLYKYLEGNMTEDERSDFERKIQNNARLKETIEVYKGIDGFMNKEEELEDVKQTVKGLHTKYENRQQSIKVFKLSGIAASIIILLSIGTYLGLINKTPDTLYKKHYTAWNTDNTLRSITSDSLTLEWIKAYESKAFNEAINKFNALPESIQKKPESVLLLASAYMEIQNYNKAIYVLTNFNTDGYSLFEPHFNWYAALCYIKTENTAEAHKLLQKLINNKKYGDAAKEILKKLK